LEVIKNNPTREVFMPPRRGRFHGKGQRNPDHDKTKGDFLKDPCRTLADLVGKKCADAFLTDNAKKTTIWQLWEWNGWNVSANLKTECQEETKVPSGEISADDMASFVKALECMTDGEITYPSPGGACCCCW
jgi:hypothetical protein